MVENSSSASNRTKKEKLRTETSSPRCRSTSSTSAFQELNGGADVVVEKSRCLSSELARVIKPQGNGTNLWQGELISATLHGTAWIICVHGVKRLPRGVGNVVACSRFEIVSSKSPGHREEGRKNISRLVDERREDDEGLKLKLKTDKASFYFA